MVIGCHVAEIRCGRFKHFCNARASSEIELDGCLHHAELEPSGEHSVRLSGASRATEWRIAMALSRDKPTFVLVHPAWFGGWCWKKVTPLLRARGYDVYTPTLTGLGERAHLASP